MAKTIQSGLSSFDRSIPIRTYGLFYLEETLKIPITLLLYSKIVIRRFY